MDNQSDKQKPVVRSKNEPNRQAAPEPEEETPKVQRVVEGKVVIRKKTLGRKLKETFFGGDTRHVGSYLIMDVFVPAAQEMIVNIVTEGVERVIFPDSPGGSRRRRSAVGRNSRTTDYQSPFANRPRTVFNSGNGRVDPREAERRPRQRSAPSADFDLQELVIPSRAEAEQVLASMDGLIGKYGRCTVNELYDLVGVTGVWTGESYGWESIAGARARRDRSGGYWLDLPDPEEVR